MLDVPGPDGQRQMQWEILEPLGENSFIEKFSASAGLACITSRSGRRRRHRRPHLRECGIEPFGGPRVSYDWKEMFVHPKTTGGVLFQLFEQLDIPGFLGGPPKEEAGG